VHCFSEHELNVTDVSWSNDSLELLSGSFDKTVKLWDIASSASIFSFETPGFVQTTSYQPTGFPIHCSLSFLPLLMCKQTTTFSMLERRANRFSFLTKDTNFRRQH
jgi:WD40 repeat protein